MRAGYVRNSVFTPPSLQIRRQKTPQSDLVHFPFCFRFLRQADPTVLWNVILLVICTSLLAAPQEKEAPDDFTLQFSVDGKEVMPADGGLQVPANAKDISVAIKAKPGAAPRSNSFRYRLEGVDSGWQCRYSDMGFVARFLSRNGDPVRHDNFFVSGGDSPGWKGTLKDSIPVHRRETVTVPNDAERLTLIVSSAGGPPAVGIYSAANVSVSRRLPDGSQVQLFPRPGFPPMRLSSDGTRPVDWIRDGVHPSLAKVAPLDGPEHSVALCIFDDDATAHAEWRLAPQAEIPVTPGETLILQWDELYCIGTVGDIVASYHCPPAGNYRLAVKSMSPMGTTSVEKVVRIIVFRPYWMQPWFWNLTGLSLLAAIILGTRAVIRARLRADLRRMEQKHAIERERLRIARDLHDDLGARLTHISFLSQRATGKGISLEESQEKLRNISDMTKNLVSSLYETVWSVDPENDHLDALVGYLTQMVDQLCGPLAIRYRIKAPDSIPDCAVASDVRHNISLAAKEAIHNAIKHSAASELTIAFEITKTAFIILISDNGRGFDPKAEVKGNGLRNLQRRMTIANGSVVVKSATGCGTTVRLEMPLQQLSLTHS